MLPFSMAGPQPLEEAVGQICERILSSPGTMSSSSLERRWQQRKNLDMSSQYQPIENHGIIGNMRTAALVSLDGSVDWLCLPHFDSPSVFAAILDAEKGGRFRIAPAGDAIRHKQFYWPDTNILITRFLHADGVGEVEDYMPVGGTGPGRTS